MLPQTTLKWHAGDFKTADAVFVCGNHTRNCAAPSWPNEDVIQVLVGSASETPIFSRLPHIDRPLAFSLPVTDPDIEPAFGFDAASPAGTRIVLENFENCLRAKLAQFAIGKQLKRREPELQATTNHVLHSGKLLAVINFMHFQIGLHPDANPQMINAAIWEKRPKLAAEIPQHFLHTDVAKVMSIDAQYSQRDLLPKRYRHKPIYDQRRPTSQQL